MILDTNTYSALMRGLPSAVAAVTNAAELALPLPVVAELRYGFLKGGQADRNEEILTRFLAQPQATVLTPTTDTTRQYAELQLYCATAGRALSQNDIWIAALAREHGDTLVTYDADFNVFQEIFGDKMVLLRG